MSKKLQLTIAEPCHENWDDMSPVEKGKFCGSCQKQVVDFSNMNDRQVAEFFKKPSTGSVCGRFMTDQLDRDIEIPRKRIPWVKYFFQIALPAFLVSMKVSAQKTQGTIKVATKDTVKRNISDDAYRTLGMVALPDDFKKTADTIVTPVKEPVLVVKGQIAYKKDTVVAPPVCNPIMGGISYVPVENKVNKREIEGIVVDEFGQPVPFANIQANKAGELIMADAHGTFKIKSTWLAKGQGIMVSSAGFENVNVKGGEEEYSGSKLYVRLKSNGEFADVIVGFITVKKQPIADVQKDRVVNKEIKLPVEENNLFIYPNPVLAGTTINLSFKKLEEGYYQLQVLNQAGQSIHQKEIWIDAEARLLNIDIPVVAAGTYFLVLSNKKTGKKFTGKIVIQ